MDRRSEQENLCLIKTGTGAETGTDEKTAILVVSFGTSYKETREQTIDAIEKAVQSAFPQYGVRRAFTSRVIIKIMKTREGMEIDSVEEALLRAEADGIRRLAVLSTHVMDGYEYHDLRALMEKHAFRFDRLLFSGPLLSEESDFDAVVRAVADRVAPYLDGKTAVCFLGHGTGADSNAVYGKIQNKLREIGNKHCFVGTVEAGPTAEEVLQELDARGIYENIVLKPLMVVAGDHANNDMAGGEDSWRARFERVGYKVTCLMEGLGQMPEIQEIYVRHVRDLFEDEDRFNVAETRDKEKTDSSEEQR